MPAQTVIKIRRDTSTNWSSVNPTLAAGEIAFETDTNKIKVGDGSTVWASLDYASGAGTAAEISYNNVDAELIATTVKGALDELSNNKVDPADLTAVNISADTTNFTGNLSSTDTTVQAALDTLDDLEISAGVTTSDTPPVSPGNGDLWWESDTGILYIYYDNFWVEAVSGIVGPQGESGAVISDTEPADQDVLWVDTSSSATAESTLNNGTEGFTAVSNGTAGLSYQPISHNYIINGAFDVWQRGDSFTSVSGEYTADRWYADSGTLVKSTDIPDEAPVSYSIKITPSGTSAFLRQGVELPQVGNPGPFNNGATFTYSFYAKTSSGTANLNFFCVFAETAGGTGVKQIVESSTNIDTITDQWQRFTRTFTVDPGDITGATCLTLNFYATNVDADVYFTGYQLEAGSIATPFKRNANSIAGEELACFRYYYRINISNDRAVSLGSYYTSTKVFGHIDFPVPMRASPTLNKSADNILKVFAGNATRTTTTIASGSISRERAELNLDTSSATQGDAALIRGTATGFIEFNGAEL